MVYVNTNYIKWRKIRGIKMYMPQARIYECGNQRNGDQKKKRKKGGMFCMLILVLGFESESVTWYVLCFGFRAQQFTFFPFNKENICFLYFLS